MIQSTRLVTSSIKLCPKTKLKVGQTKSGSWWKGILILTEILQESLKRKAWTLNITRLVQKMATFCKSLGFNPLISALTSRSQQFSWCQAFWVSRKSTFLMKRDQLRNSLQERDMMFGLDAIVGHCIAKSTLLLIQRIRKTKSNSSITAFLKWANMMLLLWSITFWKALAKRKLRISAIPRVQHNSLQPYQKVLETCTTSLTSSWR